jgi:D-alanyl-D-alanine carboxypeptidase
MKKTVAEDPTDPNSFHYGLGLERVNDACGTHWGHRGAIFGYQSLAYWDASTGRTAVITRTMFPAPAASEPAFAAAIDLALCAKAKAP